MPTTIDNSELDLGDRVEDTLSGMEGTVVALAEHLTGCSRVGIAPVDPSRCGDDIFLYADQVTQIELDDGEEVTVDYEPTTSVDFDLGELVTDSVTGFEGVVAVVTFELYNCPRVGVQSVDVTDSTETGDMEFFDAPRLESQGTVVHEELADLQDTDDTSSTGPVTSDIERTPSR